MDYTIQTYIRKLLAGTLLEEERENLIRCFEGLSLDESAQFFEEIGEELEGLNDEQIAHIEQVLLRMQEKKIPKSERAKKYNWKFFRMAAVFLLLLGVAWIWKAYWRNDESKLPDLTWKRISNPVRTRTKILLPDSSWIWLNAGSTLEYPERFLDTVREVRLDGEAYFEVHGNSKQAFIVHTKRFSTQVLGTSFNIKVFEGEPQLITVHAGKVKVSDRQEERIVGKNEQVYYGENGLSGVMSVQADEWISWKNGILNLDNKTLGQAAKEMERWYGVQIVFTNEALKNCEIAGQHTNVSLSNVLKSMAFMFDLHYTYKDNQVLISGNKCSNK